MYLDLAFSIFVWLIALNKKKFSMLIHIAADGRFSIFLNGE